MDIDSLSKQDAIIVLKGLIEIGTLHEKQLTEILKKNPSDEMKRLVDFFHSTLCKEEHAPQVNCSYFIEESFDDCWERKEHSKWLGHTTSIMQYLDLFSGEGIIQCFSKVKSIISSIAQTKVENPAGYKLILLLSELKETKNAL